MLEYHHSHQAEENREMHLFNSTYEQCAKHCSPGWEFNLEAGEDSKVKYQVQNCDFADPSVAWQSLSVHTFIRSPVFVVFAFL